MSTCGHANVKGARFSATCGAALATGPTAKATQDEVLTIVLPGLDQSPEPAPSKTKSRARKQRKRGLLIATIIGLVVALAASTFAVVAVINRDDASAEVYLEAANRPGTNPFTKNVTNQNPKLTNSYDAKGKSGTGVVLTVAGTEPGLHGGTQNNQSCDPQKLVRFLASEPAKAAAWAGVLGITPAQIPKYVASLTPTILRADARVTNHGFTNGKATVLQSVLQAGTAVLVDDHGIPRARCSCGNPLTEPEPVQATYTGTPWPNFDEQHVVAISKGPPTDTFTLTDPTTGTTFSRPTGTSTDTGVFALGTDNGIQLLKDGKVVSAALPGQRVTNFAQSPDRTRLAFFSQQPTNDFENPNPTTLYVLERDGRLTAVNSTLQDADGSLTWIDATHLAYAQASAFDGDPGRPATIEATAGSQPSELANVASYGGFESAPGQHLAIGTAWYSAAGTYWIDFSNGSQHPADNLSFDECGNGPYHSCSTIEFSPNGASVLAVSGQGVEIASPGGAFTLAIAGENIQAFWLDSNHIAYTTHSSTADFRDDAAVHIFDVHSRSNEDLGPGTAIGPMGNEVLVALGSPSDGETLVLLDPASKARRPISKLTVPKAGYLGGGLVESSFASTAVGFATGDTGGRDYPYIVDGAQATVTPVVASGTTDIFESARSPVSEIRA